MKTVLCLVAFATLSSCATYSYDNSITITTFPDGRVEEKKSCKVSINSTREIKGGTLKISKGCSAGGGAEKAGVNDDVVKMFNLFIQAAAAAAK